MPKPFDAHRCSGHHQHKLLRRLVADAVTYEPLSAAKFPANREKNRDLFNSGLFCDL
jgi:hypothetical protein